jgi:hypothetical protein
METTEQHHVQFFLKPEVLEKVGEMAACLSEGAKLLDKAHGLLVDLRNSNALVITGDVVSAENSSCIANVAEEGLVVRVGRSKVRGDSTMSRNNLVVLLLCCAAAPGLRSISRESKALYQNNLLDDAKRELIEVLYAADSESADKALSLYMLGMVNERQGQTELAAANALLAELISTGRWVREPR